MNTLNEKQIKAKFRTQWVCHIGQRKCINLEKDRPIGFSFSMQIIAYRLRCLFAIGLLSFSFIASPAQEIAARHLDSSRNYISIYFGLLEANINYEWKIKQFPKAYSNVRLGIGHWTNLQADGNYINASLAHMLGKRSSHVEFNLGLKLIISGTMSGYEDRRTFIIPDIYLGYRYEKPARGVIFRAGFSLFSFINIGVGYKF